MQEVNPWDNVLRFSPCSDHEDELEIRELHRLVTGSIRLPSFLLPLPPSWIHKVQAMYVVPTVRLVGRVV